MTKTTSTQLLFLLLLLALLPSCSIFQVALVVHDLEYSAKFDPIDMPEEYRDKFSSCRGFDFGRSFPFNEDDLLSVNYDFSEERRTGKDGLYFQVWSIPGEVLFRNMKHTNKEKKYVAAYKNMSEEFDRKYAGEIKKKIDALTIRGTYNGKTTLDYPYYLEGDQLQEGLVTPASIFSVHPANEYPWHCR